MTPAYRYKATVVRVIDGDTAALRVDCGFRVWLEDSFRFYGINAPELIGDSHEAGLAAKQYLESLLPAGTEIIVETFKPKDKYGRWLGILYVGDDPQSINDKMVEAGQAVPYFP